MARTFVDVALSKPITWIVGLALEIILAITLIQIHTGAG